MLSEKSSTLKPALALTSGRILGALVAFLIPLVLVRVLDTAQFGTYKQVFLLYTTLFGVAQLGMAESLYYFLPHESKNSGRYVANALIALVVAGLACMCLLLVSAQRAASAMNNPALASAMGWLGLYLALMLASNVLEIAMTARGRFVLAAASFAVSDVLRATLFIVPVVLFRSVGALLAGAALFAGIRLLAAVGWLWKEYGSELRPDLRLLRVQLGYALPFAAAVMVHILQENFHQYAVSSQFDAASFAIYAVGCLQIPLVDFLSTSVSSVMMVKMSGHLATGAADADERVLEVWHETARKLALLLCPLVGLLLVNAREIIEVLFTSKFLASAPIFTLWSFAFLAAVFQIDGALRVYADTRFLLMMNLARLALVLALIHPFIGLFGQRGAVIVSLMALFGGKAMALLRIRRLMGVTAGRTLPWNDLGRIAAACALAMAPAIAARTAAGLAAWPSLVMTATVYGVCCATLLLMFKSIRLRSVPLVFARTGNLAFRLNGPERTESR